MEQELVTLQTVAPQAVEPLEQTALVLVPLVVEGTAAALRLVAVAVLAVAQVVAPEEQNYLDPILILLITYASSIREIEKIFTI